MKPIVDAQYVLTQKNNAHFLLIDARAGTSAYEKYLTEHLEDAVYVDLEKELARKTDPKNGGRHPLPDLYGFAKKLGTLGVSPQSEIYVYDEKTSAMAAARFWWMMKSVGHEKVFVINGGLYAAVHAGFTLTNRIPQPKARSPYPVTEWKMPIADMHDVEEGIKNNTSLVIDVREAYRYNGESEPIDLIAGHIPGAINIPYIENLDRDGNFLSEEQLKTKYEQVLHEHADKEIICQCGSGVTACHTILALAQAGLHHVKLYVGSWSEWSRNNKPIITKE
jgi:thiosulfate/3-mercaptopyruvate sulfurtransferase